MKDFISVAIVSLFSSLIYLVMTVIGVWVFTSSVGVQVAFWNLVMAGFGLDLAVGSVVNSSLAKSK